MKKNFLEQLVLTSRKSLQARSLSNYWAILELLCQDYAHYDFTRDLSLAVKARDVGRLIECADCLSEQMYPDATLHFVANQLAALIRKYPFPEELNPFDPEGNATKKFAKSEHRCSRINMRLRLRRAREFSGRSVDYANEFHSMRQFVSYVIGHEPRLEEIYDECGFGPGASLGVHGNATNVSRKLLAGRWSVSPSALHYGYAAVMRHAQFREILLPEHGGFCCGGPNNDSEFQSFRDKVAVVDHNTITFVPKTVKTLRSIAVEPLLNGFVQKGIDVTMRKRLRRIGIDLTDQAPNQRMALLGSFDDEDGFVTIDLSSASDSISIEVVRELLPPAWFSLLDATRSKSYAYKGLVKRFSKFCSMGNGFCFPLETLLFTAACTAVGCGRPGVDFRVYGDDIVCRKSKSKALIELLFYMGFSVNEDKTFLKGPFRESCGADWFGGEDVRPYTFDYALDSVQSVFKFLNMSRRSDRTTHFFSGVRPFLLALLPERLHFYRPFPGNADTAIDTTGDEHLTAKSCRYRFKNGTGTWSWYEVQATPMSDNYWRGMVGQGGETALLYGALSGSASARPFALRNITRTKVRLTTHSGATSLWLPAPALFS